jgi:hypothetical protein
MTLLVLGFILFDRESILSMERWCLSDPERDESGVLRPVVILVFDFDVACFVTEIYKSDGNLTRRYIVIDKALIDETKVRTTRM